MRIGLAGVGRIGAFHAETLKGLDFVEELVLTDANTEAAREVADRLGTEFAPNAEALLASGVDGFVIAAATPAHAPLLRQGVEAGVPTFCEKPVASSLDETIGLAKLAASSEVPVHIGFQRRFDRGYQRLAQAVQGGELGFVHSIRAATHDQSPPARGLHPHQRRHLPRLQRPRLRHPAVRHRPRGGLRLRHGRQQG